MDPVGAHLDHDEIIPVVLRQEMTRELEPLLRHLVNVGQDLFLVAGAEVAHVENVFPDDLLDLLFESRRVGVLAGGIRREEVGHHRAIERLGRVGARHADDNRAFAALGENFPEPIFLDREGVGDRVAIVGMIRAIAKSVNAKASRALRRHHDGPGRDRDRRIAGAEVAVDALFVKRFYIRQVIEPAIENQFRRSTIEPNDHDTPARPIGRGRRRLGRFFSGRLAGEKSF